MSHFGDSPLPLNSDIIGFSAYSIYIEISGKFLVRRIEQMLDEQVLVDAKLYPDRRAVIQDALRALLREKPQLRVELAIHRYETEDISLAHAAHLAGVSFDRMKALMVERGVQLRLGPADEAEARQEIDNLGRVLGKRRD